MLPDSESLKKIAMANVQNEPPEYTLRYIFRWYSKTFSTPLHVVPNLVLEDVLLAFFECQYEELNEPERNDETRKLLISKEDLTKMQRKEDAEDAEAWMFGRIPTTPKPVDKPPEVPVVVEEPKDLKPIEPLPEGIHMSFEDDEPAFQPPPKSKPE